MNTKDMILESFHVSRNHDYQPLPGQYTGTIKFRGDYGTIELTLDNSMSSEVLRICANAMTKATKDLAGNITAQIFEQADTLLENKTA